MNGENSHSLENVINPKSLERQMKIIEQRLTELQSESSALEKRREACQILLGLPLAPMGASVDTAAPVAPNKKSSRPKKKERTEAEAELENAESELPEEISIIRASELHA